MFRNFIVICWVNSVLFDFKDIPSDVKSKLIDTFCLDLYGSQLGLLIEDLTGLFSAP